MAKKATGFTVENYALWSRYRTDLLRIEARSFGAKGDSDEGLENSIKSCLFLTVIVDNAANKAFGYVITQRSWPETAYIAYVAIDPEYRGKGHLKTMLETVESELRVIGFTHFEIRARLATLAGSIAKNYADRIEASYEHGSGIGPLRFFRVRLEPPTKSLKPNPVTTGSSEKERTSE